MRKTKKNPALIPTYTDEELLQRVLDLEAVRDLMNRRFYYIANEMRREEINELWVTEPDLRATASFGKNWGYYVGMRDITDYYVVRHHDARKAQLAGLSSVDPTVENIPENMYIGCSSLHPISTPRVFLAYDGKTAQGLWHSVGLESYIKADGTPDPHWITERVGADFIKEKSGQWRIWHLVQISDMSIGANADLHEIPRDLPPEEDPIAQEFGTPTIPMITHEPQYNWEDNYPHVPKAYQTYSDEMSYGPKGHPDYEGGA